MSGKEALLKKKRANLLATSMDGPSVSWTVADLFSVNNRLFMTYHVMGSGYDYLTPLGCAIGAFALPKIERFSNLTKLQAAGTGGLVAGGTGMTLGFLAMVGTAYSTNPRLPWTEDGIQMRVDGLRQNYTVRSMDLGVWLGIGAAGAVVAMKGGPVPLGLSPGVLGVCQAAVLGSGAASLASVAFISATK